MTTKPILALIRDVAKRHGVPRGLLTALVWAESGFDPYAKSPVGAMGLCQLMPKTAEELGVKDAYDPWQNLNGGAKYLRQLLDRYDGDVSYALAAYNWGMGNLDRKGWDKRPEETRKYVEKILKALTVYGEKDDESTAVA